MDDKITELFDEYYGAKTAINERLERSDALVEQYVKAHGKRPPASVLSRLATYILLDDLSDRHPDKMSREEYPIMSDNQQRTRWGREKSVSDVYTGGDDATIGRYKDEKGIKRRMYDYMTPAKDSAPIPTEYLALYEAIEMATLTKKERQVLAILFVEDETQATASERLGVSQARISQISNSALVKIRKYLA